MSPERMKEIQDFRDAITGHPDLMTYARAIHDLCMAYNDKKRALDQALNIIEHGGGMTEFVEGVHEHHHAELAAVLKERVWLT
jgi:hypothetical protein